ncbi:hypothetical protein V6N13_048956 [Hibiscus sabdariffa]
METVTSSGQRMKRIHQTIRLNPLNVDPLSIFPKPFPEQVNLHRRWVDFNHPRVWVVVSTMLHTIEGDGD